MVYFISAEISYLSNNCSSRRGTSFDYFFYKNQPLRKKVDLKVDKSQDDFSKVSFLLKNLKNCGCFIRTWAETHIM